MDNLALHAKKLKQLFVVGLCACLLSLPAFGQSAAGRILGAVTDKSGGVVANATVIVTDGQRGVSRTLTTDQAGEYSAPSLLPGTYTIRAEAAGFSKTERQNIKLEVSQDIRVDLILQPGEQTTTVTVTEEIPLVETTSSTLGGTLSNETINDLPLNGRNYQNLVNLRPGSFFYVGGGGWTQTTDGVRPEDSGYIVEGLPNDHPLTALSVINGAGAEGDAATILPIDAIQEFNVLENPPAQYGWKPGAIVSVGLKSGTNSLHGTAYAFGRSDAFDARNYFNSTLRSDGTCNIYGPAPKNLCDKTGVELKQWGATVGGPIKKDKLFYFLGFEDEHYSLGNLFPRTIPEVNSQATVGNPAGDTRHSLPDAILDLENTFGLTPSALSMHLTGCTQASLAATPVCTGGLYPANNGSQPNLGIGYTSTFGSDNGLAKIDYHINDHNTLSGMYFIAKGNQTVQDPGTFAELQPYWLTHQYDAPQVAGTTWTWIPNSNWVNEARFGFTYMNRENDTLDHNKTAVSYGINTGVTAPIEGGFPTIVIAGLSPLGGFPGWPIVMGPTKVFQGNDTVSYLHGKHAFKFGAEVHHNSVTEGRFSRGKGVILFLPGGPGPTPLEEFMSGTGGVGQILNGSTSLHLTTWQYAFFMQDDWRVTPRVTLNMGLRYEYVTPIKDANNQLGNFDPTLGLVQVGKQISSPYNGDHLDFGPRLGLAWDVTGKGTTVVHVGATLVTDAGLPMFTLIGQGGTQNNPTLGLGAIPTGAQIITCPAGHVDSTGTCDVASTTVQPSGDIQYSTVKAGGPPFQNHWNSQDGTGAGQPIWNLLQRCGDGVGNLAGPPNPFPCNILAVDRKFRNPFVTSWTLGIEHAFTSDLSLNAAYVGNRGSRLPGITDINQPIPVAGSNNALPGPFAAKFPYLANINWESNLYRSSYHGLQATLTQRPSHGLSFVLGYTYSHAIDGVPFEINTPLPKDSRFPQRNYDSSIFDIRHRFTFSMTYALPGINAPAQLLKGWKLNSIVTLQTGTPWGVVDSGNNVSGTNELTETWDFFGNPNDFKSGNSSIPYCASGGAGGCTQTTPSSSVAFSSTQSDTLFGACQAAALKVDGGMAGGPTTNSLNTFGCFAQGNSVMIPPTPGTFGTMGRNPFRDPGFKDWDLSITKGFQFKERLTAQFRAELFNVLNHPTFTNPYGGSGGFGQNDASSPGQFGCGCATPDQAAGNPVLGTGGARAMQLGLKLIF